MPEEPQTYDSNLTQAQSDLDSTPTPVDNQPSSTLKIKELHDKPSMKKKFIPIIFAVIAIGAGIGTGYGSFKLFAGKSPTSSVKNSDIQQVAGEQIKTGDVFGSPNEDIFKDSAEGYLEAGGLDGEGSHRLLRPGGESQTVYLTSSVTDLDKLVGMEIQIWGETFQGQKAGWLIDVGRVKVLDTDGTPPRE